MIGLAATIVGLCIYLGLKEIADAICAPKNNNIILDTKSLKIHVVHRDENIVIYDDA